jgi:hypothetical protein
MITTNAQMRVVQKCPWWYDCDHVAQIRLVPKCTMTEKHLFLFWVKKAASTRISQLKHILKHYVIIFIDAETTEIPKCYFFNCIMLGNAL